MNENIAYLNAKKEVKYASASDVAKMLMNGTWDGTCWPASEFVIKY